jgi:hypothetical protein
MIIPVKRNFEITRGENLQEVPISTFLPKRANIHAAIGSLIAPNAGNGPLGINEEGRQGCMAYTHTS